VEKPILPLPCVGLTAVAACPALAASLAVALCTGALLLSEAAPHDASEKTSDKTSAKDNIRFKKNILPSNLVRLF
jgi:hypothetical protein